MYGIKAMRPLPGEVAATSVSQDGQAQLNKPNKHMPGEEQYRQIQASPNKLTPGKVERRCSFYFEGRSCLQNTAQGRNASMQNLGESAPSEEEGRQGSL